MTASLNSSQHYCVEEGLAETLIITTRLECCQCDIVIFSLKTLFLCLFFFLSWILSVINHLHVYYRLFVEILRQVTDVDEIQFIEDGSWSPIKSNKQTHTISSTPSRNIASGSCKEHFLSATYIHCKMFKMPNQYSILYMF